MKNFVKKLVGVNLNENSCNQWLKNILRNILAEWRILDAGKAELRNKILCNQFNYVSQDVYEYEGKGNASGPHAGSWDASKIDACFDAILCCAFFERLPKKNFRKDLLGVNGSRHSSFK